jgi:acyl carrier protein
MACSYLDCLSRYRRARGLPAVSINWGALGQVGMATRFGDVEKYLSGSGVGLFTPVQAIQLLERVLSWNPVELAVAKMEWERWAALYPTWARSAKYADLLTAARTSAAPAQETQFREQLLALSATARAEAIASVLIELLAQTMETTADQIDRSVPLPSLGLDSLMAMDLQLAIEKSVGVKVPMLALMKGNNLEQLAQQVATSITAERTEAPTTSVRPSASKSNYHELPQELDLEIAERMIAKLDDFADEEVDRMLELLTREQETRQ